MPTGKSPNKQESIADLLSMPSVDNSSPQIFAKKYEEEEFDDDYVPDGNWVNENYTQKQNEKKLSQQKNNINTDGIYSKQLQNQEVQAQRKQPMPNMNEFQSVQKPYENNKSSQLYDNAYSDNLMQNVQKNNSNILGSINQMKNLQSKVVKDMSLNYNNSPVKYNLENSHDKSNLVVHNAMEDLVVMRVNTLAEKFNCCMCEKCLNDIAAISLNALPSKYIVAPKNQIEALTIKFVNNPGIDIDSEVIKAIMIVKTHPRH